ncbi:hypothetical protein [Streptomyces sp. NPDC002884]
MSACTVDGNALVAGVGAGGGIRVDLATWAGAMPRSTVTGAMSGA